MWKFYIVHYILTRNWESLLLRLQGIFEGTSKVLKRKNKTEHYFSIEAEFFLEKGNSISSLYWINIKVSLEELLPNSSCSEAPHLALFRWKSEDLGLPGMSWCSEHFQGLQLVQQGQRDRAATAPVRGAHFFPFLKHLLPPQILTSLPCQQRPDVFLEAGEGDSRELAMHRSLQPAAPSKELVYFSWQCPVSPQKGRAAFLLSHELNRFFLIWRNWHYIMGKCSIREFWPNFTFYLHCSSVRWSLVWTPVAKGRCESVQL